MKKIFVTLLLCGSLASCSASYQEDESLREQVKTAVMAYTTYRTVSYQVGTALGLFDSLKYGVYKRSFYYAEAMVASACYYAALACLCKEDIKEYSRYEFVAAVLGALRSLAF